MLYQMEHVLLAANADGSIFDAFKNGYTVQELEATKFPGETRPVRQHCSDCARGPEFGVTEP